MCWSGPRIWTRRSTPCAGEAAAGRGPYAVYIGDDPPDPGMVPFLLIATYQHVEAGVPIGESLAEARRQAGLTIGQVSHETRIRESIIRDIEQNDFSACGGDFYAPGHIRRIAAGVGTHPGPLISAYDARPRPPRRAPAAPG